MSNFSWKSEVETALGCPIRCVTPVLGGDIHRAFRLDLDDGRRLFCKANELAAAGTFAAEARGLALLSEHNHSLVVPQVQHASEQCLVLSFLDQVREDQSESLGRGLAALHRTQPGARPGADFDGFIGTLPQTNSVSSSDWLTFFRDHRLLAQLQLPKAQRLVSVELRRHLERLMTNLHDFIAPHTPLCVVHGDLWSGNFMFTSVGPAIFDPAPYMGAAEVDLAMMTLFGGFPRRVFEAYFEVQPALPGHEERRQIYQLYPLLVHLNLFGASYLTNIEAIVRHLV